MEINHEGTSIFPSPEKLVAFSPLWRAIAILDS
jgi:hypothetical protein